MNSIPVNMKLASNTQAHRGQKTLSRLKGGCCMYFVILVFCVKHVQN